MLVRQRNPLFSFDPNTIDRAFSQLASSFFEAPSFGPAVRADWAADQYVITVDLPGVPAEAVSVELTGNTLKLSAKSGDSEWSRTLRLGGSLDPDKVSARHLDGRLTVAIGKFDQPAARKVAIDTTPAAPAAIEASSPDASSEAQESSEANTSE